ncbi:MAG: hypothetical protein IIT61_03195 [Bacteroidales bacterium]|nr:hypothetical protein [Bacteroidales bacterium]MBQ2575396.1 hypothetical protein [Bacteroidales bacterium]MBQ3875021.1 hypothetical protein [Bacteroidaceae bacterium]MBQ5423969.1 hypothetical protein [Bacteroidales bacterium]MBQ5457709.1 hypothetical protein [Bacteroidales bacterium]
MAPKKATIVISAEKRFPRMGLKSMYMLTNDKKQDITCLDLPTVKGYVSDYLRLNPKGFVRAWKVTEEKWYKRK